jgi:NADH:ubiquinone oxidoreductase subunit K
MRILYNIIYTFSSAFFVSGVLSLWKRSVLIPPVAPVEILLRARRLAVLQALAADLWHLLCLI